MEPAAARTARCNESIDARSTQECIENIVFGRQDAIPNILSLPYCMGSCSPSLGLTNQGFCADGGREAHCCPQNGWISAAGGVSVLVGASHLR